MHNNIVTIRYRDILNNFYITQQRHRTDRQVNNRESKVLRKGHLVEEKWHRVQVIYERIIGFVGCIQLSAFGEGG